MAVSTEMSRQTTPDPIGANIAAGNIIGTKKKYPFIKTDAVSLPHYEQNFFFIAGMAQGQDPKHAPGDLTDNPDRFEPPVPPSNI